MDDRPDAPPRWQERAAAPFCAPDFREAMSRLRRIAANGDDAPVALIIPDDQILYTRLPVGQRAEAVGSALDGLTPYAVDELAWDWRPDGEGEGIRVAAVARQTLREADEFARRHGFSPASFLGDPGDGLFPATPRFHADGKDAEGEQDGDVSETQSGDDLTLPGDGDGRAAVESEGAARDAAAAAGVAAARDDAAAAAGVVAGDATDANGADALAGGDAAADAAVVETADASGAAADIAGMAVLARGDAAGGAAVGNGVAQPRVSDGAQAQAGVAPTGQGDDEIAATDPAEDAVNVAAANAAPEAAAGEVSAADPLDPALTAKPAALAGNAADPAGILPASVDGNPDDAAAGARVTDFHGDQPQVTAPDGVEAPAALSAQPAQPLPTVQPAAGASNPLPDRAAAVLARAGHAKAQRLAATPAPDAHPGARGGVGGLVVMLGALVVGLMVVWAFATGDGPATAPGTVATAPSDTAGRVVTGGEDTPTTAAPPARTAATGGVQTVTAQATAPAAIAPVAAAPVPAAAAPPVATAPMPAVVAPQETAAVPDAAPVPPASAQPQATAPVAAAPAAGGDAAAAPTTDAAAVNPPVSPAQTSATPTQTATVVEDTTEPGTGVDADARIAASPSDAAPPTSGGAAPTPAPPADPVPAPAPVARRTAQDRPADPAAAPAASAARPASGAPLTTSDRPVSAPRQPVASAADPAPAVPGRRAPAAAPRRASVPAAASAAPVASAARPAARPVARRSTAAAPASTAAAAPARASAPVARPPARPATLEEGSANEDLTAAEMTGAERVMADRLLTGLYAAHPHLDRLAPPRAADAVRFAEARPTRRPQAPGASRTAIDAALHEAAAPAASGDRPQDRPAAHKPAAPKTAKAEPARRLTAAAPSGRPPQRPARAGSAAPGPSAVDSAIAEAVGQSAAAPGGVALSALTASPLPMRKPARGSGPSRDAVAEAVAAATAARPAPADRSAEPVAEIAALVAPSRPDGADAAERLRLDEQLQAQAEARARAQASADAQAELQARAAAEARARAQAAAEEKAAIAKRGEYRPPENDDEPEIAVTAAKGTTAGTVAKAATVGGMDLAKTQVIGVIGAGRASRGLIRLRNGKIVTVRLGDKIDGGAINSIGNGRVSYVKGGRQYNLAILNGR